MRNAPLRVDGIAMEAPSDLIVDATPRHPLQSSGGHVESAGLPSAGVRAQQELDRDGPGKLRRAAEAPILGIVNGRMRVPGLIENRRRQRSRSH